MNKYKDFSRECQKIHRAERSCYNKRRYSTREESEQKGQRIYSCNICNGFHRSGSLASLVAKLTRS